MKPVFGSGGHDDAVAGGEGQVFISNLRRDFSLQDQDHLIAVRMASATGPEASSWRSNMVAVWTRGVVSRR